ncbi:MAG: hypothetical protein E4H14_14400 [Candidatus Thorarchaeota archaeon]|nr:MAG: hypothetical protein E4H14_14400 [Candidatus Thorarchaeota archaeon]
MTSRGDSSDFNRLGIDVDSSQMMILKAVMAAAGGPSKFVSYKEIAEHLQKLEKKKYTKAYIYRHLSDLKDEGYLVIDSVQTPRGYAISESGIISSFDKKQKEALSERLVKKQEITTKFNRLKIVSSANIAYFLYNQLMGVESAEESIIIEGIENVRSTVIREFGKPAKAGDEIRVIAPASLLDGGLESAGMAEMSLMVRAADGVKIIGLMLPQGEHSFTTNLFVKYLQSVGKEFTSLATSGNIILKVAKEHIKTYRMVSLNREKMLLYLTHAADSDMAALIHLKDNPGLIDDAVDTFDKISAEGIDVIEIVKQMLTKKED